MGQNLNDLDADNGPIDEDVRCTLGSDIVGQDREGTPEQEPVGCGLELLICTNLHHIPPNQGVLSHITASKSSSPCRYHR